MSEEKPIALRAYEALADRYSALAESKAENGYIEHPAMRSQLTDVAGLSVLDAGCGPGFLGAYLAEKGAKVTGFDISPRMIELAGKRTAGAARLFVADLAKEIPALGAEEFDLVTSSLAIDYVKDWTVPLNTFRRVLKPGGKLVFSVQHPLGAYLWYKPASAFGVQLVEAQWRGFGGEPVTVPDYYRPFEEMINPLVSAGFVVEKILDAKPVPALMEKDPELFAKYSRTPTFMIVVAKRG
ncbi:MAG: hypothetical protein A2X32_09095 [Elusimicrobia bacterium GWC2_64_44]|nr:MAG: hypothetical protein A2X32_09095 [Elusimicrobia bacterium GWC2_64_44]